MRLYLITDANPRVGPIESFLRAAIGAGVGMVQLREKHMSDSELFAAAERFGSACRSAGALFIVNDRVDIALTSGADGVHLGQEDLEPAQIRRLTPADFLIGLSTHSTEQIDAARDKPVDYTGVGPVFQTPTKPGRPAVGTQLIRYAAAKARVPFFAIGGIDPSTIVDVVAAGASRVSVLRWIAQAEDPAAATRALLDKM